MITFLWRSDCHLADLPPQSRTDNWANTILGKLIEMGGIARSVNAHAVLDGGDFFHVKSPVRNTHELVQRAAGVHATYPCPTFATIGNHDLKYGNQEYLHESPLEVLFSTGVFGRLYDDFEVYFGSSQKNSPEVGAYPYDRAGEGWVNGRNPFPRKLEPIVRVVGIQYHGNRYDLNRFTTLVKGEEDFLVAVVHCCASPEGGTLFEKEDVLRYADLANMAPDVWLFAHYHIDQGVQKVGDKVFVNVGSVSRGALVQDNLERIPCCVSINFTKEGVTTTQHPLTVKPSEEVFDLVGRARAEGREMAIESFVESLKETLMGERTTTAAEEVGEMKDIPDEVRERTIFYLEQAGV